MGFLPTSAVAHVPFDHDTWILDPTRPRLIDMLTPREILWMRKEPPATRVMMVANDLGCNIQRLAVHLIFDREFVQATTSNMQGLLDSYKACARIVDTPIPFPYAHMLAFILFVFVYFSPFVYMLSNSNPLLGIIPSVLLVLAYYGIEEVRAREKRSTHPSRSPPRAGERGAELGGPSCPPHRR